MSVKNRFSLYKRLAFDANLRQENCPVALLVDEAEGPCCILAHVEVGALHL